MDPIIAIFGFCLLLALTLKGPLQDGGGKRSKGSGEVRIPPEQIELLRRMEQLK